MLFRRLTALLTTTALVSSYLAPTVAWARERAQAPELVEAPASTSLPDGAGTLSRAPGDIAASGNVAVQAYDNGQGGRERAATSGRARGVRAAGEGSEAESANTDSGKNSASQNAGDDQTSSTPKPTDETGEAPSDPTAN